MVRKKKTGCKKQAAKENICLTMQAGYVIVSISVSGYFKNTEYPDFSKCQSARKVLFGTFFVAENFRMLSMVSACRTG